MNFEYGIARRLYANGLHPRIYLGPEDLDPLRRRIRAGVEKTIMAAIRRHVRPFVERIKTTRALSDLIDVHAYATPFNTGVMECIQDIALVGLLDEDADAMAAVRRILALAAAAVPKENDDVATFRDNGLKHLVRAYDLAHPRLSFGERRAFASYAYRCGIRSRFLEGSNSYFTYYKRAGQNMHIASLMTCILTLLAIDGEPGVPDCRRHWRRFLRLLEASLYVQFNPNGYPEEDIGYGTLMAAWLAQVVEPLRRAGIYDVYTKCPPYTRFGNAMLHFVQPWGDALSNTGDHGDGFRDREFILARLAQETASPELLWLLGALSWRGPLGASTWGLRNVEVVLKKGFCVPATTHSLLVADSFKRARTPKACRVATAFHDPRRGIVSFRSGWEADATLVEFDGSHHSPAGAWGHNHAAGGHFSLSALGEYFSIDTGRYNMEQNCHSVVLINGKSGRTNQGSWSGWELNTGLLTAYRPGAFVDTAACDSTAQHRCTWARRHLGLVKGVGAPAYVWTVDDIGNEMDWGRAVFWWQLHTSPENKINIFRRHATLVGWRHGNLMDVHFALPAPDEYPKPHRLAAITQDIATPSAYQYIKDPLTRARNYRRPADMVHGPVYARPRLIAKIEGPIGRFMAVMLPRRKGAQPPRVRRLPSPPCSLALRIAFPEVEDVLIFAFEHGILEAADVVARGQWCVVRRSRRTGRILNYAVGQGTSLTVKGRELTLGDGSIQRRDG